MKRFPGFVGLAIVGFAALAASALADQPSSNPAATPSGGGRGLRHVEKCLSSLGLTSDVATAVDAIVTSGQATLSADAQSLKSDHEKLRSDLSSGADKSVIGQDVLNQQADRTKMHNDMQSIREQILAKLTPDQQTNFNACAQASHGHGWGRSSGANS